MHLLDDMPANDISFFENHMSKKDAKMLAKYISPGQVAQQMQMATDIAYAMKGDRILKAKAECELRRKRKQEQAAKSSNASQPTLSRAAAKSGRRDAIKTAWANHGSAVAVSVEF